MSYLSYASSSIIFDIVAYSMSGKLYSFVASHEGVLFFFPGVITKLLGKYLMAYGYSPDVLSSVTVLLISLPIITFVAGIMLHKAVHARRTRIGTPTR